MPFIIDPPINTTFYYAFWRDFVYGIHDLSHQEIVCNERKLSEAEKQK